VLNSMVVDILEFARMQRALDAVGQKGVCEERTSTDICSPEAGVQVGLSSLLVPSDVADTMTLG